MSDSVKSDDEIRHTEDGIRVTFRPNYDTITAWAQVRENLGLNPAGPAQVEGVELVNEIGEYHEPDDEYPYGYSQAVLLFEDPEALERASDRLFEKATEMFEYGIGRDAQKVQDFASRIPSRYDVPEVA